MQSSEMKFSVKVGCKLPPTSPPSQNKSSTGKHGDHSCNLHAALIPSSEPTPSCMRAYIFSIITALDTCRVSTKHPLHVPPP